MPFVLPRAAEREYLTIYGLHAVYIAAIGTGPTLVGSSRDLYHSQLAIRRTYRSATMVSAYWMKDEREARLICNHINEVVPHGTEGLLVANATAAQRHVEVTAARMSIQLTDHQTILSRVRSAVSYVDAKIEAAQAAGELRWFNRAYREWRLEAKARGRTMSYSEARARLRRALYRQVLTGQEMGGLFPTLNIQAAIEA